MKKDFNRHGRRLSGDEYDKKIVQLYSDSTDTDNDNDHIKRKELDLSIDHRLGLDFPDDRRQEMWDAHKKMQSKLAVHAIVHMFKAAVTGKQDFLPRKVEKALSTILDKEELEAFLGPEEERVLPPAGSQPKP